MSDIPTRAEYVLERLAEYLVGIGCTVDAVDTETLDEWPTLYVDEDRTVFFDGDADVLRRLDGAEPLGDPERYRNAPQIKLPGFPLAEVVRDVARRDALLKLTERYDGCAGDVEPYALGEVVTSRFAVILLGGADYGARADADTLEAAQADALRDVGDSLCADYPWRIVDLDTGEAWEPVWSSLVWTSAEPVAHIVPGTTRRV